MSETNSTPHQLTEKVKLLHKTAIVVENKVLILKRSEQAFSRPGKWDLPGGNSDWPVNEAGFVKNLHQLDVSREIQEETGLVIKPEIFTVDNLVYFATYFNPRQPLYSINCGWQVINVVEAPQDSIQLSSEHTQYEWIDAAELENYDFGPPERDFETKTILRALS